MSVYDPHRIFSSNSSYRRHKGQVIQSRLVDRPVTIDQRLVPIYRDFLLANGLIPSSSSLPIKLANLNFHIPGLASVDFTFERLVTTWTRVSMTLSGNFWEYSRTSQPLYSFCLGFVPLDTGFVFYVSGTQGDSRAQTNCPVSYRIPSTYSTSSPLLYFTQIAVTPPDSSPYFGYLNIQVTDDTSITFSGRQLYYADDTTIGQRVFYPPPQFLPRSIFDLS